MVFFSKNFFFFFNGYNEYVFMLAVTTIYQW